MKTFSLLTAILAFALMLAIGDAEAASKRFGAGKSSGMQRETTAEKSLTTTPAPASATSAAKAPSPAAAPQAQPKRSWMGPLAGLAAGLGLAALASHFGFGEELASMLMIGLLVMAVVMVIGFVMRRRAGTQQPAMAEAGGLQYAAVSADGHPPNRGAHELALPASSAAATGSSTNSHIPEDFDAAGFVRNAKLSFIRLQAANDHRNLDDIREFTTPEMFAEIRMNIAERGDAEQETDVVTLNAEVVEVSEETNRYVVSVRFNGLIRDDKDVTAEPIDEIWHMVKPRDGRSGWVLAGIQQIQ
jgi:predicted lipid-binding transport protein (Tim44 family)